MYVFHGGGKITEVLSACILILLMPERQFKREKVF